MFIDTPTLAKLKLKGKGICLMCTKTFTVLK